MIEVKDYDECPSVKDAYDVNICAFTTSWRDELTVNQNRRLQVFLHIIVSPRVII